jgi:hypothetical protein
MSTKLLKNQLYFAVFVGTDKTRFLKKLRDWSTGQSAT